MNNLNRNTTATPTLPTKIIQFGGGNFLRAFVDWMVQVLNEETDFNAGVTIIKPTERGDYQELKNQDGRFTVVLDGIKNGETIAEKRLVSCVTNIVNAYTEWEHYLELAKNPDLRFVVSNTTEAGIKFNPEDRYSDAPPKEFPAKLTVLLHLRFQHFKADSSKGCILLPCELIVNNGEALQKTVLQYAQHWELGTAFAEWIKTANHFCSTLVDRIVSGYPKDRGPQLESELGYKDSLMVAGEYYHSWVIQANDNVQKEMPFAQTNLNVQFVDDLLPYREMKVRILNGAHTAMVPVAYLAGIRLVDEAMANADISNFINELLLEETAKTLNFPQQVKEQFVADVLDRFRNPLLKHQLISIALNSSSKFVARLLPTLKDYVALEGKPPKRISLGLAALILFYQGEFKGEAIALKDDADVLAFFKEAWQQQEHGKRSLEETVEHILAKESIWGENLNAIPGLTSTVFSYIASIKEQGVQPTLNTL